MVQFPIAERIENVPFEIAGLEKNPVNDYRNLMFSESLNLEDIIRERMVLHRVKAPNVYGANTLNNLKTQRW